MLRSLAAQTFTSLLFFLLSFPRTQRCLILICSYITTACDRYDQAFGELLLAGFRRAGQLALLTPSLVIVKLFTGIRSWGVPLTQSLSWQMWRSLLCTQKGCPHGRGQNGAESLSYPALSCHALCGQVETLAQVLRSGQQCSHTTVPGLVTHTAVWLKSRCPSGLY